MGNKKNWNKSADHFVLYMDIMGFKERVVRNSHDKVLNELKDFKSRNNKLKDILEDRNGERLRLVQFSDSIILASINGDQESLIAIIKASIILMWNALESGFAIKGAIAKGKMTFDEIDRIYFGAPLVDAFLLEEELKFYGIVFHHTVEDSLSILLSKSDMKHLVSNKTIYLKSGKSQHYTVAYHQVNKSFEKNDMLNEIEFRLQHIGHTVSGGPRIYIDNTKDYIQDDNVSK